MQIRRSPLVDSVKLWLDRHGWQGWSWVARMAMLSAEVACEVASLTGTSAVYSSYRRGPRTLSRETPTAIGLTSEMQSPNSTWKKKQLLKYSTILRSQYTGIVHIDWFFWSTRLSTSLLKFCLLLCQVLSKRCSSTYKKLRRIESFVPRSPFIASIGLEVDR